MATSRSSRKPARPGESTARALVYSGRPDPTWPVPSRVVKRLLEIWDSLPRWRGALPAAPPLGYRGCVLRDPKDRRWLAYGGAVTLEARGKSESRGDPDRSFEKALLASAPRNALPASFLQTIL